MEQRERRRSAARRKSVVNDYGRQCETRRSHEKEDFFDSREKATEAIKSFVRLDDPRLGNSLRVRFTL